MLITVIVLGLALGLLLGGRIWNLADVRFRWLPLLFLGAIVRFGTELALGAELPGAEVLRLPLFIVGYALLLAGLWLNRHLPGLGLGFLGILANAIAIVANGGFMPIWEPSLFAAGFTLDDVDPLFHVALPPELTADFLRRAGFLSDVIPIPLPFIRNVASIGDLFLSAGLGFFLFATVLRTPRVDAEAGAATPAVPPRPETGLAPGLSEAAVLERPVVLGSPGAGMAGPSAAAAATVAIPTPARPAPRPWLWRLRRHPYVRLAVNPAFTALWTGQQVSLFGDRIHQIALAALVLTLTGSALATGLVFVAATLPNLLLAPIAGTYVDRWNARQVMIVSDLLRAAIVLLLPVAALINIVLVYPLILLLTSISVFFRPARVTILPRIVREDEVLPANSALWIGETLADLIGYPLATLFVTILGSALPLAFWFDAVSYVASAILIATISVAQIATRQPGDEAGARSSVAEDLRAGWAFLRNEQVLLTNTIQGALGQIGVGVLNALAFVFAVRLAGDDTLGTALYGSMETAIGAGSLVGGFVLGLVASRFRRGPMVAAGYLAFAVCLMLIGVVPALPLVVALAFGIGISNMVFVIPSQALFQERTPPEFLGRAVGFRFAAVFGTMTIAMALASVLAEVIGPGPVLVLAGLAPLAAAIGGFAIRAAREV